ncbi:MAG: peptidylprolyl isomerase [Albidovulum sp.]|nr:peptidylprolyl isomerase [Albidovulum sp.]MDE0531269.1 peptidylprolyl isomerase [Albidovulum sp.]
MRKFKYLIALAIWVIPSVLIAQASPFATAITVNGIPISNYEISQRALMLRALSIRGNLKEQAENALIDERLYLAEAKRLNYGLTSAEIEEGMLEFAARANLSTEEFLAELVSEGVDPAVFQNFVVAGLLWRKVVSGLYSAQVQNITNDDIDLALQLDPRLKTESVLLSEIVIAKQPGLADASRRLAQQVYSSVRNLEDFREAATAVSQSASRQRGGDIGWLPISRIPAAARTAIQSAPSGSVIPPIELPQVIYIFFKRGMRKDDLFREEHEIDYATLQIRTKSRERSEAVEVANRVMSRVATCTELLLETQAWPKGSFKRQSLRPEDISEARVVEIAKLDHGEFAILPGRTEGSIELLMLCRRLYGSRERSAERDAVFNTIRNQRLESYAQVHLRQLRANAIIRR